ncbi:hypothetical protein RFUL19S_05201 [Rhizobacter fulvus]|jgi:hypothetical protein
MARALPHGVWIAVAVLLTAIAVGLLVGLGVIWMLSYSD